MNFTSRLPFVKILPLECLLKAFVVKFFLLAICINFLSKVGIGQFVKIFSLEKPAIRYLLY